MAAPRPLLRSFAFAWDGLTEGAIRDRNLRIHLALGVLAGTFVARAPLAPAERALLALCVTAVIAAEALNSSLEAAVDLASPGRDERARVAKDSAAGAVLALAAGSVLAFVAVAGPRLAELASRAGALALPFVGALVAALAAGLLPARSRPPPLELALLVAGAVGLVLVVRGAESQVGSAVAALCLAVSAGGAARRRPR